MKYVIYFFVIFLSICTNFSGLDSQLMAQNQPVTLIDRGSHLEMVVDYTTGISQYEMGKEIAQKILQFLPKIEQLADKSLDYRANRLPYAICLSRLNDIKPQVPQEYQDEIDGIASIICTSDSTIRNDGKLSKEEMYLSFLSSEIFAYGECSSISVFGPRSENSSSITARLYDTNDSPDNYTALNQAVITIKNKNHSICMIGTLSIGAATGFNDNGVFVALHSSNAPLEYSSKNKRSYMMDVRYALEHFSTSDEIAEYFIANSKNYVDNNLIQLTDKYSTRILENNFSADGKNTRCILRSDTSTLNPGITWGYPNAIATANSFVLKGNYDNHTNTSACYARWNTFKNKLNSYGDKITWDELKQIASYDNNDGPDLQSDGDIYNVGTMQITLFQPDNLRLEVAFKPRNGTLPEDPVFETIPVNFDIIKTPVDRNESLPSSFTLEQNYPNPFNPVTSISYKLPVASHVELKVFGILGNEITTLVDEFQYPGNYKVEFDCNFFEKLSSGIYIYRLITDHFSQEKKMVLLK